MNPYRQLPSVDKMLEQPATAAALAHFGRDAVLSAIRQLLEESRAAIAAGEDAPDLAELSERLQSRLAAGAQPSIRPLLNATGVIIHTNLGRAPLSQAALQAMHSVGQGYSNLEYDLAEGRRGSRYSHAEALLCELTGAEAALVVNNNAAALMLLLRGVAAGREVVISRGELVEIGGGFRIPDILRQSGARLVEVGTTNRTRVADYAAALSSDTAALLKVHPSNFAMIGFTAAATLAELVQLVQETWYFDTISVLNDLGSGALLDTQPFGLAHEPTVQESVQAGAAATTFSGDKLLGGPQAGIIVGQRDLIAELKQEPLARALRVDKGTLAALQATLLAYRRGQAVAEIPVWQMIGAEAEALARRAQTWADQLIAAGLAVTLRPGESAVGGGS
ncbi:MAG: L-seryl-tRNA(Sec) selenium transferase, partial [Caldilineales bacterium]|nr:L-seryl-tRNA(Sec) selenium transferase [Caldilineales bacterium]